VKKSKKVDEIESVIKVDKAKIASIRPKDLLIKLILNKIKNDNNN